MKYQTIPLLAVLCLISTILGSQDIAYVTTDKTFTFPSAIETNITMDVDKQPLKLNELVKPVVYDIASKKYYYHSGQEWIPINNLSPADNTDLINLNNGNVRIGVGTAEQKLHIFGNTKISDSGNSDGKLFIGTTPSDESTAADYNLLVGGKAIMTELKVNVTNSWPDYVFDTEYSLMPINKLEDFINKNKHLPGIPSADQIKSENGFHVGDMQKKMLEKIEELTLYIIDLKKENETIKSELLAIKDQVKSKNK
jgi:hypothetical protein